MKLSDYPNIGQKLEKELNSIGINSFTQLKEIGSVEAIKRLDLKTDTCLNKLYALEGAIQETRWHKLEQSKKEELKHIYNGIEKKE